MNLWDLINQIETAVAKAQLPPANTTALKQALANLQAIAIAPPNKEKEKEMTAPVYVQILQSDLDTFATEFETVTAILKTYIAQLLANVVVPLTAADEAGLTQALADLDALEPPTPTP